jgi:hypothetical protein
MKYRKKPVIIEAIQFNSNDISPMLNAWGSSFGRCVIEQEADSHLVIYTLEGNHIANMGDWIIKGIKGEFYPCKPDIFELTYELETTGE